MNKLFKFLVDALYRVGAARRRFGQQYPGEAVLAADGCKAIRSGGDEQVTRGAAWVTAQRVPVLLSAQRLEAGTWMIPLADIEQASLVLVRTWLSRGQVLNVATHDGQHFQFGMQYNPEWQQQQALPLRVAEGRIQHSWFSIVVRLLLVAWLTYWVLTNFIF